SAFAIAGGQDAIAFGLQTILERRAHRQLVFDDEQARVHDDASKALDQWILEFGAPLSGISIVNLLPWPTALWTCTRPPWDSTMCFTMVKPMPMPRVSRRSSLPRR